MTGFLACEACGGLGFVRTGGFADRKFIRCGRCNGLGQMYLKPVPMDETPVLAKVN